MTSLLLTVGVVVTAQVGLHLLSTDHLWADGSVSGSVELAQVNLEIEKVTQTKLMKQLFFFYYFWLIFRLVFIFGIFYMIVDFQ